MSAAAAAAAAAFSAPGSDAANLRLWYETTSALELRAAELAKQLEAGERALSGARDQNKAAQARRRKAATERPLCQRARRLAVETLVEAEKKLEFEQDACASKEKDMQGLKRTLANLLKRREQAAAKSAEERSAKVQIDGSRDALRVECASLKETISSMEGLGKTLQKRIAAERDKRLRLKACVRVKVEQIDKDRAFLHERVQEYVEKVEEWQQRAVAQDEQVTQTRAELADWRAKCDQTERHIQQRSDEKRAVQREYLELQRGHDKLRAELAFADQEVAEQARAKLEAHRTWRAQHMEKVDARVHAQLAADRDLAL